MDICLVIDSSGSIREEHYDNYEIQLQFLADLVTEIDVGQSKARIGAVLFSEQVVLQIRLNDFNNVNEIREAIFGMPYLGGGTNSPEALRVTRTECFSFNNGNRPAASNVAILVTDGVPYPPERREHTILEAAQLKNSGVRLIVVGISRSADRELITTLSSPPQQEGVNFFSVAYFPYLDDIISDVMMSICLAGNIDIIEGGFVLYIILKIS